MRRLRRLLTRVAGPLALLGLLACQDPPREWAIGIYGGPTPFDLSPAAANPVLTAADVSDIRARFVADPFLWPTASGFTLLFEVWNRRTEQGDIAFAESADGKTWRYGGVALDEPFHLSYPYLFEHQGAIYLIPESKAVKQVRLYRAEAFPRRWRFLRTLLSGDRYADSSLVLYHDRFWLFTSPRNDRLLVFFADRLEGPWTPHPGNPVVRGRREAARPGGRLLVHEGRLFRYAQSCAPAYGVSASAFEITDLSPTAYAERPVRQAPVVGPSGSGWNRDGMHHVDPVPIRPGQWLAAVDGWRQVPSPDR